MKMARMACFSAVLVLAPLAVGKLPVPNETFGRIESALDFCSQADPDSASKYQERKKALVQEASEQEIAEARASKEYKDGYEATSEDMGKQPKEQVKKTCTAAIQANK